MSKCMTVKGIQWKVLSVWDCQRNTAKEPEEYDQYQRNRTKTVGVYEIAFDILKFLLTLSIADPLSINVMNLVK